MKKRTRKDLDSVAKLLASIAAIIVGIAELIKVLK